MSHFRDYFFSPPQHQFAKNPFWKHGFLGILLCLLGFQIWRLLSLPPTYPNGRYVGFVVPVMLILNHLSAYYDFGPRLTFPLRALSTILVIAGAAYVFSSVVLK